MSEPRPPTPPDEHDAWLRQALRHAPDAAAAPPQAVREAILREARSAVRMRRHGAAPSSLRDRAAAFWAWLARPPVAAAFASVMAATLVGMMWWDRPMDETAAPPPSAPRVVEQEAAPPRSATPEATPAPRADLARSATSAAPATAVPARPGATEARRSPAAPAKVAPGSTPTTPRQTDADKKTRETQPGKDRPPPAALQAARSPTPFPGNGPSENAAAERERAAAPVLAKKLEGETAPTGAGPSRPVVAQASATAAETAPRSAAPLDEKTAGAGAAVSPPAEGLRQRPATLAAGRTDALDGGAAAKPQAFAAPPAAPREATTRERRAAASPPQPMAPLLDSIASGSTRWDRAPAADNGAGLDPPTRAWLESVAAAAAGRWQAVADRATRAEGTLSGDAGVLELRRDAGGTALVRIEDGGVFFELASGRPWFAPLAPDAVARLRATLPANRR